jgi:hypothetical protein
MTELPLVSYFVAGFLISLAVAVVILTVRTLRPLLRNGGTRSDTPKPTSSKEQAPSNLAQPLREMVPQPERDQITDPAPSERREVQLRADRLMTESELCFYKYLHGITQGEWIIGVKLPLKTVFKHMARLDEPLHKMYHYGHVDFLLLDPLSSLPVLAIELDDWRHQLPVRQDRDQRKNELFQRAGLRLERVPVGERWDHETARKIKAALPNYRQNGHHTRSEWVNRSRFKA